MKKIISIILSLTMLFAFSSCEKKPEGTDPLTRKEIETVVERFKKLDNATSLSFETEWGYFSWSFIDSVSEKTKIFMKMIY